MELTVMAGSVMLSIGLGLAATKGMLSMVLMIMERSAPAREVVVPIDRRR